MAFDFDKFWKDNDLRNQPRADIRYIAYLCSDHMGDTCAFSTHRTHKAAEKRYGDVSRHYKGSSQSDYEVIILSVDDAINMICKKEITYIDWKKRIIHWGI